MWTLGTVVFLAAIGAIVLMISASIVTVLREYDNERIEELANERVEYMLNHAEIRVVQRLEIIDEMK